MANAPAQPAPPEAQAAQHVFQLATGYIASTALQVAVRLGVADELAAGPRTAAELAAVKGVREDPLYRVLRLLASVGVFEELDGRRFALALPGQMLRRGVPGSLYDMVLWICDPFHFRVYADAMHSMETDSPAIEKTFGVPAFDYLAKEPAISEVFNQAMTGFSAMAVPAVLEAYDFSGIDVLVDVAGGHGELLLTILGAYPRMRGVLSDLEHVITGARPRIKAAGLDARCEARPGDFFQAVPEGGDAYILKHIIHDWDDDRAARILENIRRALGSTARGRVILLESIIRADNQPDLGKLMDLEMLLLPGGRERSAEEFGALFDRAGFEMSRVIPTASPLSIIEARPKTR
jgi:hypothetical protein